MTKTTLFILPMMLFLASCASRPLITEHNVNESSVEISYTLGHSHYKYLAIASDKTAEVSSLRDNKTLEKKSIPLSRYHDFATKVEAALQTLKTDKAIEDCRTPYTIRVSVGNEVQTSSGCRSADSEGKVSSLIKEGEFLFYAE